MIEIEVEDSAWTAALPDAEAAVRAAAQAALNTIVEEDRAPVVILLTDNASVRDLNNRFRGKDKPTNVLSFPPAAGVADTLGDIALAYGVCAAESIEQKKPLSDHLQHLVAHGVLHLLGYDHETDADAQEMEQLEREIMRGLGVSDPYAER